MYTRSFIVGVFVATLAGAIAPDAVAQSVSVYGASEFSSDDVQFYLLGGTVSPSGLGWKPYVGVTGYHLRFDAGTTSRDRQVVAPVVGLTHAMSTQSVSFGGGYAFSSEDVATPIAVTAESGQGVLGTFGWNYWGMGDRAYQLLASYNFGTQFLWTRGRAGFPLAPSRRLWVGGEAALLGGGETSTVWLGQFGPTVEWRFSPQFRLGGSAGLKVGLSNASGSETYGRIEFLWLPTAK